MEVCLHMFHNLKYNIQYEFYLKKGIGHDLGKLLGQSHKNHSKSDDFVVGTPDGDAARMSRNRIKSPEWDDDDRNFRRSMTEHIKDGQIIVYPGQLLMPKKQEDRIQLVDDVFEKYDSKLNAGEMFLSLLNCTELSIYNESPDLAFTSLKYHTILTTVLYYNYLRKYKFEHLYFGIVDMDDMDDEYHLFEVIFIDNINNKCWVIKPENNTGSFSKLEKPEENFNDVLSKCGNTKYIDPYVFSNLRRISSWSTGLQYYDDVLNRGSI